MAIFSRDEQRTKHRYTPQLHPWSEDFTRTSIVSRLSSISIRLLMVHRFLCYIGIAYQLPGAVTGERANLVTTHLKAMGMLDSAKILSWYLSMVLVYLPAWTIVSIIWHIRIFTMTSGGLVFIVHVLLGLILASYSFFIAAPFGKSPQLAAVASTFISVVFAIIGLVFSAHASTGGAFIFSIIFPPGWYVDTKCSALNTYIFGRYIFAIRYVDLALNSERWNDGEN